MRMNCEPGTNGEQACNGSFFGENVRRGGCGGGRETGAKDSTERQNGPRKTYIGGGRGRDAKTGERAEEMGGLDGWKKYSTLAGMRRGSRASVKWWWRESGGDGEQWREGRRGADEDEERVDEVSSTVWTGGRNIQPVCVSTESIGGGKGTERAA
ncbi:hypothetical protein C8J57DRAFT_1236918 [Mycena rebaudengoi]|nr:hypothetical protein C8J57DRAFT_1236918 [Mycena rebaudengoi]